MQVFVVESLYCRENATKKVSFRRLVCNTHLLLVPFHASKKNFFIWQINARLIVIRCKITTFLRITQKKCDKICVCQKKAVLLHPLFDLSNELPFLRAD